jgi:hypothetical protein
MPTYLQNQPRDLLRFSKVRRGRLLFYGWKTKDLTLGTGVSAGDVAALGHKTAVQVEGIGGAIGIMGANSPKPARATKILTREPAASERASVSSFVDADSYAAAMTAGWNIGKARGVSITNNSRTVTVGALVEGGGYYLFPMNANDAPAFAAELGLFLPTELSESDRHLSFTGTSKPRPPRVKNGTTGASTFCSYDAMDTAKANGWTVLDEGLPMLLQGVAP